METVVCDQCGQRFAIHHDLIRQDVEVARKQASWVKDQLVWDHIQERKHHRVDSTTEWSCHGCNKALPFMTSFKELNG
jgi:protein-arginine kinase activator protein McsA